LATTLVSPLSSEILAGEGAKWDSSFAALLAAALTPLAVVIHGYHPFAEDGGLYLPEVKRLLHPGMYPHDAEFVVGHLRGSLFATVMAGMGRVSHLPVETVFLLVHLASLWVTLFAACMLAARCYRSREARCGVMVLLTAWMTLPIAGTSLLLMDPYVTARSFSTPCTLLALVGALEFLLPRGDAGSARRRGLVLCLSALAAAIVMHPLMGVYAVGCVMVLGCVLSGDRRVRVWRTMLLCVAAIAVAGALQMTGAPESATYQQMALTRDYWFLNRWQWYQMAGLAAPLLILALVADGRGRKQRDDSYAAAREGMAQMAVSVGVAAILVAALFGRVGLATHFVARLQPLRIFQTVYLVMIVVVGAALSERVLRRSVVRWVSVFLLLAGVMVVVERQTYPKSERVELQGMRAASETTNQWERAFVWISRNTPNDALFALDPHYITSDGEDSQGFRAIAERSVLPDYTKDGGLVANKPALTAEWMTGQIAQSNLNAETDAQRMAALKPLGVSWVVLASSAATGFQCDYANQAVKVCRLP
jgi:hypothetical protein